MVTGVDRFFLSLNKVEDWINNRLPYFYKDKKSLLEYHQMTLYGDRVDMKSVDILLKFYTSQYQSLNHLMNSDELYYRKIEYLALMSLKDYRNSREYRLKILNLFNNGFLHQLLLGDIPLDILLSREHLYAITHDIFYTSVSSKDKSIFEDIDQNKLSSILELSLLISIKRKDIDVIMELMCCISILNIEISDYILEISVSILANSQVDNGFFIYDEDRPLLDKIEDSFPKVYHTTLVANMLNKLIKNNTNYSEVFLSKTTEVKPDRALELLQNITVESIDLLYEQMKNDSEKYSYRIEKLKTYKEIIAVYILIHLFYENIKTVEKLLVIYERIGGEVKLFRNRLMKLL